MAKRKNTSSLPDGSGAKGRGSSSIRGYKDRQQAKKAKSSRDKKIAKRDAKGGSGGSGVQRKITIKTTKKTKIGRGVSNIAKAAGKATAPPRGRVTSQDKARAQQILKVARKHGLTNAVETPRELSHRKPQPLARTAAERRETARLQESAKKKRKEQQRDADRGTSTDRNKLSIQEEIAERAAGTAGGRGVERQGGFVRSQKRKPDAMDNDGGAAEQDRRGYGDAARAKAARGLTPRPAGAGLNPLAF